MKKALFIAIIVLLLGIPTTILNGQQCLMDRAEERHSPRGDELASTPSIAPVAQAEPSATSQRALPIAALPEKTATPEARRPTPAAPTPAPRQAPPTAQPTPTPMAIPSPTPPPAATPCADCATNNAAAPLPERTPTPKTQNPVPTASKPPPARIVGEGCYAHHKEGASWPEVVDGVEGVVTCSNNYYYFRPAAPAKTETFPADSPLARTIICYYGNRVATSMGILAHYPLEELEARLLKQARIFDQLNGDTGVTIAFDYIYLVANSSAHPYSHYTPGMDLFEEALAFAEKRGILFFIDLQLGYRDIEEEVRKVLPYLMKPNVHLAIDPEFYMGRRKGIPGDTLGSMDAEDINKIQAIMQEYINKNKLPAKILKVYQFDPIMLTNKHLLNVGSPKVHILINADGVGHGGVEGKIVDYNEYASEKKDALGIKLFLQWDFRLLSPEELVALTPRPREIVYQ
ncbi:MAG: hypothetical protein ABIH46_03580 [Chloroflexota bacterium]